MNTRSRWPNLARASGTSSRWVVATGGFPVSSFLGVRQAVPARRGELAAIIADARSMFMSLAIQAITTRTADLDRQARGSRQL
jgi:hypothetical protein